MKQKKNNKCVSADDDKENKYQFTSKCMCVYANCKTIVKTIAASLKLKFYCDQNLNYYGQKA